MIHQLVERAGGDRTELVAAAVVDEQGPVKDHRATRKTDAAVETFDLVIGAFGTVFTAIAVAHTLYAPREVVFWNWRRILLLGLSLALTVGNQFSLALLAMVILPIMLWVAPVRPRAVLAIWTTAIAVGLDAAVCRLLL